MPALREFTGEYLRILNDIDEEPTPEQIDTLILAGDNYAEKAANYCWVIRELEGEMKSIQDEEKRLYARRKAREGRIEWLKRSLQSSMNALGMSKIKTTDFTINIQNNPPAVKVIDYLAIPLEYFIQPEPQVDKKAILSAIKDGKPVPGAELTTGISIRIR